MYSATSEINRSVRRKMVKASLCGEHTHCSTSGTKVHIFIRDRKFLARGRYQGQQFGETLGTSEQEAISVLRRLMVELDEGRYVPPSNRTKQSFPLQVQKQSLKELVNCFLAEKRAVRGKQTSDDYQARLAWLIDFWEHPESQKRWYYATKVDRTFCLQFKAFLNAAQTTRNGRAGATPKPLSAGQIHNIMECFRTLLMWGCKPQIRKLPTDWIFPLTVELVGKKPKKSALRQVLLGVDERIQLVECMDSWQLCHLCMFLVLPLRAGEVIGLLVNDVDEKDRMLWFGTRFEGSDFTKGHTEFVLPYPRELEPLLQLCKGGRKRGPLLRSRSIDSKGSDDLEIELLLNQRIQQAKPQEIVTAHDRKLAFRKLLVELGGLSFDGLSREMVRVLESAGLRNDRSLKTFREAVSNGMKHSGMNLLDLRFLTGHSSADIMDVYTTPDPEGAMANYYDSIRPLLNAISRRARLLGITSASSDMIAPNEQAIRRNGLGAQVVHTWYTTDVESNVSENQKTLEAQSAIRTD